MFKYESSKIWKKTLAVQDAVDPDKKERELLRISLESFRKKAEILAGEIPQNLNEFTVHDISHLDALWEMIDIITYDEYELNPAEAYVLGGAILIHDLGLALAAYPGGLEELKHEIFWSDTIVSLYKETFKREPTDVEIAKPDKVIEKTATQILLRHFHAYKAESLALINWKSKSNSEDVNYFIDDIEIRQSYGKIIGLIAHSHWWSVEELTNKLNEIKGAATFLPSEWHIDLIKIACLLRIADAIHIDDRRAPDFLWALRELSDESNNHWNFQNKLFKPIITQSKRLRYTTKSPFKINESEAWWLCYDALKMIDIELNKVDSLFSESGRQRLSVLGLELIDNPQKLAKQIETEGWVPIDTKIRVGSVAKLVKRLGGRELYGNDMLIPLRELIQNSCDAIRARRLLESLPDDWGDIFISEGNDEFGNFITIEDNGVGMSPNVISGPFLDFGQSFWNSSLMLDEFPGLQSRKFKSTGQYGIGFFSSFMWGDKIKIISRKYTQSFDETWCLEFKGGLSSRPLLRKVNKEDRLNNGGTKITIWLRDKKRINELVDSDFSILDDLCRYIAPAIDANLFIKHEKKKEIIIASNDWLNISKDSLINRISDDSFIKIKGYEEKNLGNTLDGIYNTNGKMLGRGFISYMYNFPGFAITTNGIRAGSEIDGSRLNTGTFHGIIEGIPLNSSRSKSNIQLSQTELDNWVTKQVEKISQLKISRTEKLSYSLSAISLGGNPLDLPFAAQFLNKKTRFLNYSDIIKQFKKEQYCIIRSVNFSYKEVEEYQSNISTIYVDQYQYHNQRILEHIENYNYGRNFSKNTGLSWVENALLEAWEVEKLNIEYFDGDDYHSKSTIERLILELNKIGIEMKFKKSTLGFDQNIIAIAKRN